MDDLDELKPGYDTVWVRTRRGWRQRDLAEIKDGRVYVWDPDWLIPPKTMYVAGDDLRTTAPPIRPPSPDYPGYRLQAPSGYVPRRKHTKW